MKTILFLTGALGILIVAHLKPQPRKNLVYVPVGDSYTIGTGVEDAARWPNQLVTKLNSIGRAHMLPVNPAKSGFTTEDLLKWELPVVKKLKPDLVTLLIGANDWVQNSNAISFRRNMGLIMDQLLANLNTGGTLIVLTIPDFSASPRGKNYAGGRNISKGLSVFNQIIKEEANTRGIKVVDIFPLSQGMARDSLLVASDGLHPSGVEYRLWVDLVLRNY